MTPFRIAFGYVAALGWLASRVAHVAAQSASSQAAALQVAADRGLPPGEGRDLLQTTCTVCHAIDVITAEKRSPEQWAEVVAQMQDIGLAASEEDLTIIRAYLSQTLSAEAKPATTPAA